MDNNGQDIIRLALTGDIGSGGVTTAAILGDNDSKSVSAVIVSKSNFVLSGVRPFTQVFSQLSNSLSIQFLKQDTEVVGCGETLVHLSGVAKTILTGERTALNFLQHLSAIATHTKKFCDILKGSSIELRDTRKTTPGLRFCEREAVRHGGGTNHRFNLATGILIKENHIKVAGSISEAIARVKKNAPSGFEIEVETETLAEVSQAISSAADMILLDNMTLEQITEAISMIGGRCKIEVSGGVTLENLAQYRNLKIDFISTSAITRGAQPIDLSLLLR